MVSKHGNPVSNFEMSCAWKRSPSPARYSYLKALSNLNAFNSWVAVKERKFNYHNPETIPVGIYPHCGNLS